MTDELHNLSRRVDRLEEFKDKSGPTLARIEVSIANLSKTAERSAATQSRVVWILIAGIGMAGVNFIINGGLAGVS